MAARTDLLLDADGDLPIEAPIALPVGPSDLQHIKDMFNSFPGEWKQYLPNGIGVSRYLKSTGNALLTLRSTARQALLRDGYDQDSVTITSVGQDKLVINVKASK
jgi:hypothetical protein